MDTSGPTEQELIDRILERTKYFVPAEQRKQEPTAIPPAPGPKVNKQVIKRRRRNHVELG